MNKAFLCENNDCDCYKQSSRPMGVFDYTISLIQTGLQLYGTDSIKSQNHGKQCLIDAIAQLSKINVPI